MGSSTLSGRGPGQLERASRLMKYGVCRGAKPLCRESEGVPQIQFLPPSWPGRGSGGWSKGFFITLLGAGLGGSVNRLGCGRRGVSWLWLYTV